MTKQKSDFKRFCETMWIMTKYDILPWVIGAGLFAAFVIELRDSVSKVNARQQQTVQPTLFQKQR